MIKNQKVKEIQNLFEGGDIDYTSLEDFLKKETFKLYNLLEIRTRDNDIIKFIKENQKSFLDIESEGKSLVHNCKINKYEDVIFLIENTKVLFVSCNILKKTPQVLNLWCFCILYIYIM